MTTLDDVYPPGICGICGGPDKRHRLADAIASDVRTGMTVDEIISDYAPALRFTPDAVLTLAAWGAGGFDIDEDEEECGDE